MLEESFQSITGQMPITHRLCIFTYISMQLRLFRYVSRHIRFISDSSVLNLGLHVGFHSKPAQINQLPFGLRSSIPAGP